MTFTEFIHAVALTLQENPSWRAGQTYFNVLYEVRPDLSERIRATPHDPFHNDAIVPKFLAWCESAW